MVHYRVHKSQPLDTVLSQMNPSRVPFHNVLSFLQLGLVSLPIQATKLEDTTCSIYSQLTFIRGGYTRIHCAVLRYALGKQHHTNGCLETGTI